MVISYLVTSVPFMILSDECCNADGVYAGPSEVTDF